MKIRSQIASSLLLSFLFFATSWAAGASDFKLPLPEVEQLQNGMRIVWFTSDKLPVVDLELLLRSGSRDDLPGKSGTAELLSATIDRGAGGLTTQQIAEKVESLGATRSAAADDDTFHVNMHGLALDADTLIDLMARIVRQPALPAGEVKREQARMLDGWNRLADYGDTLVDLAFRRSLTQGTVYSRGAVLSSRELSKLTRNDLVQWWRTHFTPQNATLMVVGRVDRKEFKNKIVGLFGDWKGPAPKRERQAARSARFSPRQGEVLLLDRPSLNQAQVRMGFRAPLAQDTRHYSLIVANALLGEYFHSRLNTLIRDQLGLTYGIGSAISYNRNLAIFSVSAATRNESTGQLIQKTLEVLRGLKSSPVPTEEVTTAKEYLIGGFPLSTATLEGVAGRWLLNDLYDLGPDRLNEFVPRVTAIKPEDVNSAVSSAFDLSHLVIAVAGDAKAIEPVLKKEGFRVRRISTQSLLDGKM